MSTRVGYDTAGCGAAPLLRFTDARARKGFHVSLASPFFPRTTPSEAYRPVLSWTVAVVAELIRKLTQRWRRCGKTKRYRMVIVA
jgi:hypothetical protein